MSVKLPIEQLNRYLQMVEAGTSQAQVSRIAGVSKSMVYRWVKEAKRENRMANPLPPPVRPELITRRPPCYNTIVTRADGTQYVEDRWACGKWKLLYLKGDNEHKGDNEQ